MRVFGWGYIFYRHQQQGELEHIDNGIHPGGRSERRLHLFCPNGSLLQVLVSYGSWARDWMPVNVPCPVYRLPYSTLDVALYITLLNCVHRIVYIIFCLICAFLLSSPVCWCMMPMRIPTTLPPTVNLRWTIRGLSWLKHGFSRGYTHVGGRGCVHCVCNYGSMLQVSRSTQKLLALPQVSEQTIQVAIHILSIRSLLPFCLSTNFSDYFLRRKCLCKSRLFVRCSIHFLN